MKSYVVIGIGRFGYNLAVTLSKIGNEVLVIDEDEETIQKISDDVTHCIVGDAEDEAVLKSIGVRNFDCAIVAFSSDIQSSVLITLMLKELGVPFVVAKAKSEIHRRVLEKVGADKIVFPERDMGVKFAQSLSSANIMDYIELSDAYSIIETKMPEQWIGRSLKELDIRNRYSINVLAIKDGKTGTIDISPNPDDLMQENDIAIVIGSTDDLNRAIK